MMGITSCHLRGGTTISFDRTTWKWLRNVLLGCNAVWQKTRICYCKYVERMQSILDAGYAEEVPKMKLSLQVVYGICHITVWLMKGSLVKSCVIFYFAAVHKGLSLNQVLIQGPDLVNNLVGVLLRIRRESVASIADIESMFQQVYVAPRNWDCLRFLWWPGSDISRDPVIYRMKVHLFGATSSPRCAKFCLRRVAKDFGAEFEPVVASTVERSFYVDVLLTGVPDVENAKVLVKGFCSILSKLGTT